MQLLFIALHYFSTENCGFAIVPRGQKTDHLGGIGQATSATTLAYVANILIQVVKIMKMSILPEVLKRRLCPSSPEASKTPT